MRYILLGLLNTSNFHGFDIIAAMLALLCKSSPCCKSHHINLLVMLLLHIDEMLSMNGQLLCHSRQLHDSHMTMFLAFISLPSDMVVVQARTGTEGG